MPVRLHSTPVLSRCVPSPTRPGHPARAGLPSPTTAPDALPHGPRASRPAYSRRAFTFVEMLVVVGIITILTSVVIIVVGRVRSSAQSVACLGNLRAIGEGFRLFAVDHAGRLPDPVENDTSWEEMINKHISEDRVFRCPSDNEVWASVGSSYDWRDAGGLEGSMAGRSITDVRGDAVLAFEALPGWHATRRMNAVFADGSARALTTEECLADVLRPVK